MTPFFAEPAVYLLVTAALTWGLKRCFRRT